MSEQVQKMSRLERFQAKIQNSDSYGNTTTEKKEYKRISDVNWKPKSGENTVRILIPDELDALDVFYYSTKFYGFGVLESYPILSPNSYGDFKDPIQKRCYDLRKQGDAASKALANKFITQQKYFIPVIVRGEEDKGVQLWEVSQDKIDNVRALFSGKYGDITDLKKGKDLDVTTKMTTVPTRDGKSITYPEIISIIPLDATPLGTDAQIDEWLSNVPNPYEYYAQKTDEELMELFKRKIAQLMGEYVDQEEDEQEDEEIPAPVVKEEVKRGGKATSISKAVASKSTEKSTKVEKDDVGTFDEQFDLGEDDDLPF